VNWRRPSLLWILCSLVFSWQPLPAVEFLALERRITEIYAEHAKAMVRVRAIYEPPSEGELPELKIGTGFFISREGLVICHAQTVNQPLRIWVEHDGIDYSADLLGHDPLSNLALLRVNTLPKDFGFFHLSDTLEMPPIGSFVVRMSMPLEFAPTPDLGMINGVEARVGPHIFPCYHLRTTIPSGPGDGGAAFLDLNGRLVGVQVASLDEMASTYALPARAALRLRDDLLFSGAVEYGWMGFEIRPEASIAEGPFVRITEAIAESPAAEAGLLPGDVLRSIQGQEIRNLDDLRNAMFYTRVGQLAVVEVQRADQREEFSIRLATRPADEPLLVVETSEFPLEAARDPVKEAEEMPPPDPAALGLPPALEESPSNRAAEEAAPPGS